MAKTFLFGRIMTTGHFLKIHHFPHYKVLGIYFIDFMNAFQASLADDIPHDVNALEAFPMSE